MRTRTRIVGAVASTALALALAGLVTAQGTSAQSGVLASYELNETGGSVLVDSGPNRLNGTLGSNVRVNRRDGGAVYHEFPYRSSSRPDADQLHAAGNHSQLDPRADDFAVEVRFRTRSKDGNITQKGQSGTYGGMWKVEVHKGGVVGCVFRGDANDPDYSSIGMNSDERVTDDEWHTVRCERRRDHAALYLDGELQSKPRKYTGTIDNNKDLAIGGKNSCGGGVGCDYFDGDLDYVRFMGADTTTATTTTTTVPAGTNPKPTGTFDSVEVDGNQVVVRGTIKDTSPAPGNQPLVRISTRWDGKEYWFERQYQGPSYARSFTAEEGTHEVCVDAVDNVTRQVTRLGCREAVVK